jgi:hypothetical protein
MDKSKVYVQLPVDDNRSDSLPGEKENEHRTVSEANKEQQPVTPGMNKPFDHKAKTGSEITDGEDG